MSDTSKRDIYVPTSLCFPVISHLHIKNYALYPGIEPNSDGLTVDFAHGLTVVLGANGLGKTTLVWILYRLLSGPYDISSLDKSGELGGRALTPAKLKRASLEMFAQRVADRAKNSIARLVFHLAEHSITIARSLNDLTLIEFIVDGVEMKLDEQDYQATIAELAGLWSFGDWILLLRHLTFYFEDRRELVWDISAQRQILRLLFLPAATARQWAEAEREILKLDSRVRNLRAALTREEKELAVVEELEDTAIDVREQLKALNDLQGRDEERRDSLDQALLDLDSARQEARLALLSAEQDREAKFRALEHAKLMALQQRFPSASETAHYILAQLLSEEECLVCGNHAPEVACALETRLRHSECVVCGSEIANGDNPDSTNTPILSDEIVQRTAASLEQADETVEAAQVDLDVKMNQYTKTQMLLREIDVTIARRREKIDTLIRRLPPEEEALHKQRDELALLRSRVEKLKDDLVTRRAAFAEFIERVRSSLLAMAPKIKKSFESYAQDFLFEDCSLVWSLRKERVGQSGIQIEFPAFELDLASASFHQPVRRNGPMQVSESQREFIDLSFRMALMASADETSGSTLIIDAPESSLDTVFVNRAADVLASFAKARLGNRLVVTSNLTDGDLIPRLLASFAKDWHERLIDLFEVAEPTAAVRELRDEYAEAKQRSFAHLPSPPTG